MEKLAKKAEVEARRKAKDAETKAASLARKAESQAAHAARQEEDKQNRIKKLAQKQYSHWMRCLKRAVTQEGLDKMSVDELQKKTPGLKLEFEEAQKHAKAEKEQRKIVNKQNSEVQAQEAVERRERTVMFSFDSDEILEQVKAMCAKKGELDSCKFVVSSGIGKMPGIQVRYKNTSSAKSMLSTKTGPVSCSSQVRPAPSPTRAISFILAPDVIALGNVVVTATTALAAAKVKGITLVSSSKGQITVEFATEANAEAALKIVNGKGMKVGGMKLARGAELGMAKKLNTDGASKKRKVDA